MTTIKNVLGKYFDVGVRIQEDQVPFIDHLKVKTIEKEKELPSLIFGNAKDNQETTMAGLIKSTFASLFGPDPNGVQYNATSVRKTWEQSVNAMDNLNPELKRAHLSQTGHGQATADKYYTRKFDTLILSNHSYFI